MCRLRVLTSLFSILAAQFPALALGQAYPAKPIRTIVTVAGGGETSARIVADKLAAQLGVAVLVESQSGAGGAVAAQTVARAAADGYTLLYANGGRVFDEWTFIGADGPYTVRVNGPLQINDGGALVQAAAAGVGILRIPRALVKEEMARGELVQVLADCALPPGSPIYAVYPARDFLALKTSAFIAFLQGRLG